MRSLSREEILKRIQKNAAKVPAFLPVDRKSFITLSENILNADFYKTAPVIDKAALLKSYGEVLNKAGFEPDLIFRSPMTLHVGSIVADKENETWYATGIPLWALIWHHVWDNDLSIHIRELDKTAFNNIYHATLSSISSYIDRQIPDGVIGNGYHISTYIYFALLPKFLMHNKFIQGKKGLQGINTLNDLFDKGYGVPYVRNLKGKMRLEIRLPLWKADSFPRIIDSESASFVEVAVMRDDFFVPESLWRFPEKLTVKDVLAEDLREVKDMMLQTIGNEKLLRECKLDHEFPNGITDGPCYELVSGTGDGLLYRLTLNKELALGIVICDCPTTGKRHYLRVPPEVKNVEEALAWTFNETPESYLPLRET